jgi:hypothetical protein
MQHLGVIGVKGERRLVGLLGAEPEEGLHGRAAVS